MAISKRATASGGVSLWRIFGGIFVFLVLGVWTFFHANFVMGRSLLLAFPGWDVTYKSARPSLGGGVVAKDLTLVAPDGDPTHRFHFDRLTIDVPFFQYYRSGFSRKRGALLKSIKDLRLVFENGKGELDRPFTTEMQWFGNVSAAPFEAEGCAVDNAWLGEELADMSLAPGATELVMAWHRTDGGLVKEQSIHTPGSGRIDTRREMVMHDDYPLFSLAETGRAEVSADEWHVRDEGFVAARNAFCAKKDGVATAQFVERHVAVVKRLMEVSGLAPGAAMETAYRQYASKGGTLDLALRYDPPIGAPLYDDANLGHWLPRLHGEFATNGAKQTLALDSTPPRALPEDENDEALTVFALMQREGTPVSATGIESAAVPASAPAAVTTVTAPPAAPVAATPAPVAVASPPAAAAAPPPASSSKPPPPLMNVAHATAAPTPSLEDAPALSRRRDASSDAVLDYNQLGALVGRSVRVYFKTKEPVQAIVAGVEKGVVHIRRHVGSGWVEYAIDRAAFDYAERRD